MKIEITSSEKHEGSFDVREGDRLADSLNFEEMLGVVAQLTITEKRHCLNYLKTSEQRQAGDRRRSQAIERHTAEESDEANRVRWFYRESDGVIRGYKGGQGILLRLSDKFVGSTVYLMVDCLHLGDLELTDGDVLCRLSRMGWEDGWDQVRLFAGAKKKEAYLAGQKASGIKVGDTVKASRLADGLSMGWRNSWPNGMNPGVAGIVLKTTETGVQVDDNGHFEYPFFVLDKIEAEPNPPKAKPGDFVRSKKMKSGILFQVKDLF